MLDLEPLRGRGPEDQKFLLAGLLQEAISAPVVLVGGSLVQLYCMGAVTSLDLDIIADRRLVKQALEEVGFREGPLSMWSHPDFHPLVNIVSDAAGPSERIQTVQFEGRAFQAVSPEDAIVDRLAGAVHWLDRLDWERAVILVRILADRLDMGHLRQRAQEEDVVDALEEVTEAAKASRQP